MKVIFKYGAMNSGKSIDLIKTAFNYEENRIEYLVLKPAIDTRKPGFVYSRTGLEMEAYEFDHNLSGEVETLLLERYNNIENLWGDVKVILVDEANFLSKEVVDTIIDFGFNFGLDAIIFFGLKNDFRGNLFEGSKRIIERADKLEETTTLCWCGKKARQNSRVQNGKLLKEGETFIVDSGDRIEYQVLCNEHYYDGNLGLKDE